MPKIQRKTQKIFCNSAESNQIAVFGSMATGTPVYSNDIEELQSNEAYSIGWDAATLEDKAPFMEEMNGVQYGLSYQTAYLLQQGIPEWDEGTEYFANTSFCQVNGILYQSKTNNNIGNNPVNDTTNWAEFGFSAFVKKAGDTMTGRLTISTDASGQLRLQGTQVALGETPSSRINTGGFYTLDKNNAQTGIVQSYIEANGANGLQLITRKPDNSGWGANIDIRTLADGTSQVTVPTPATGDNSTKIATTAFVNTLVPAGTIVSSGSSSTPTGYLYCNGAAVSRTTYAKLFSAIGTTYGAGNGSTTFNLPNFTTYKFLTNATVSIKGNGNAINVWDGSRDYALGLNLEAASTARGIFPSNNQGGTAGGAFGTPIYPDNVLVGFSKTASRTGLTGTATTVTIKWYIKY